MRDNYELFLCEYCNQWVEMNSYQCCKQCSAPLKFANKWMGSYRGKEITLREFNEITKTGKTFRDYALWKGF